METARRLQLSSARCLFAFASFFGLHSEVLCVFITKRSQTKINEWGKTKINKWKRSNESVKSIISGQGSLFPWRELTAGWGRGKILWLLSPLLAPPPPPPLLLPTKHNSGCSSVTTKRLLQSRTRLCANVWLTALRQAEIVLLLAFIFCYCFGYKCSFSWA